MMLRRFAVFIVVPESSRGLIEKFLYPGTRFGIIKSGLKLDYLLVDPLLNVGRESMTASEIMLSHRSPLPFPGHLVPSRRRNGYLPEQLRRRLHHRHLFRRDQL
jgi:hypothetical protein